MLTYAGEMRQTKVKVNLLDPGIVRTRLRATAFPGEASDKLPPPESVTEAFIKLAEASASWHGEILKAVDLV